MNARDTLTPVAISPVEDIVADMRAGRIVTKQDLEALTNGFDGDVSSNALEVHISNLRRKLGRDLIETVRGAGYRITLRAHAAND